MWVDWRAAAAEAARESGGICGLVEPVVRGPWRSLSVGFDGAPVVAKAEGRVSMVMSCGDGCSGVHRHSKVAG